MAKLSELRVPATNRGFLDRVFAGTEHAIWLAAFETDPSQAPPNVWGGAPFRLGEELYDEISAQWQVWNHNTYVCISTFSEVGGSIGRRLDNFAANHAVVLDDVSTKVPLERVSLRPSWVLETSPKNYQVGFLWDEPIADLDLASRIVNSVAAQGLSDESAHNVTRYVRLPQGSNTKGRYGRPFRHIMRIFNSSVRYTPEEFIAAFELDLDSAVTQSSAADYIDLAACAATEGNRNHSLTKLAGHLFSGYFGPPAVAYELLMKWAQCCEPPLPPQEADATIRSIWRKEHERREREAQR